MAGFTAQLLWMCAFGVLAAGAMDTRTVGTLSGKVMGLQVPNYPFKSFTYQFRRIPYAQPPIGNLRFSKPKPVIPWNDTLNATYFGASCIQMLSNATIPLLPNKTISEDCLLLNIYVPPNTTETSQKPVMLFIHGGSYIEGQGMMYDASYLAIHGDIVVVTINYRLGIWGFLSTGDDVCPGNFGLWDQRLAMQWTRDNIQAFGGNPKLITIFGESAGGFSVNIHTITAMNKGLFSRAMSHSGTSNSFFALATADSAKFAQRTIGIFSKCFDTTNSVKFIQCMRTKTPVALLDATDKGAYVMFHEKNLHFQLALAPVVDGDFITRSPAKTFSAPESAGLQFFKSLDYVDGDVNSEGSLLLHEPLMSFQKRNDFNISEGIPYRILCDKIIDSIVKDYFSNNSTLKSAACAKYKSPNGDGVEQSREAVNVYTDVMFITPGVVSLNAHASGTGSTYQWLLSRMSKLEFGGPYPKWFTGTGHGGELVYLFGIQSDPKADPVDKALSLQMLSYWSNFARTGNPNSGMAVKVTWPEYEVQSRAYISLNATISMAKDLNKDRVNFWLPVMPRTRDSPYSRSCF